MKKKTNAFNVSTGSGKGLVLEALSPLPGHREKEREGGKEGRKEGRRENYVDVRCQHLVQIALHTYTYIIGRIDLSKFGADKHFSSRVQILLVI